MLRVCIAGGRTAARKPVGHGSAMEKMKKKKRGDWRKTKAGTMSSHCAYIHLFLHLKDDFGHPFLCSDNNGNAVLLSSKKGKYRSPHLYK